MKLEIFRITALWFAAPLLLGAFAGCNMLFTGPDASESSMEKTAIKGYDTVAFFNEAKAVKGTAAHSHLWKGAKWQFKNEANRSLFASAPEKYAPQYDGYCAWAMTESRKAVTDPENWKIVDGKLYLNCSKSAQAKWERDIPGHIQTADENWRKMTAQ